MLIELKQLDNAFHFEAKDASGHSVFMDAGENIGGNDKGVRPMQMLLMGLGGCSAIDIVLILKKQRQTIQDFSIKISGEREPGKEPTLWANAKIIFTLTGDIDAEKATRACDLSMNKYCSVAETLKRGGTELTWEVKVK